MWGTLYLVALGVFPRVPGTSILPYVCGPWATHLLSEMQYWGNNGVIVGRYMASYSCYVRGLLGLSMRLSVFRAPGFWTCGQRLSDVGP